MKKFLTTLFLAASICLVPDLPALAMDYMAEADKASESIASAYGIAPGTEAKKIREIFAKDDTWEISDGKDGLRLVKKAEEKDEAQLSIQVYGKKHFEILFDTDDAAVADKIFDQLADNFNAGFKFGEGGMMSSQAVATSGRIRDFRSQKWSNKDGYVSILLHEAAELDRIRNGALRYQIVVDRWKMPPTLWKK